MGQVRKRCHPTASAACDAEEARNARGRPSVVAHLLASHGRGHWFDPSTAHHLKSSTYALSQSCLELRMAAGMADEKISSGGFRWIPMDCERAWAPSPRRLNGARDAGFDGLECGLRVT